jgi:uncharacterized protein (DUF2141 family)
MRDHPFTLGKEIEMFRKSIWLPLLTAFCYAILIFSSASLSAQAPKTGKITVKITGIRNADGNLRIALRRDEATIVDSKIVDVDAKTLTAEAVFDNVAEGNYGVAVIHDENKNEKLDFNDMGIPIEGYGHSNNPAKRPGPPNFDETKFALTSSGATVEIKLIYWQ